jgi:diguanylate cyclase (GGDEF)-like protein
MDDRLHGEHEGKPFPDLVVLLLVPLLYYLGARFAVSYTVVPEGLAIIWVPNSVVLSAFLVMQGRHFVPVALLATAAELAADLPTLSVGEALVYSTANVTEAWIAYSLLRHWQFDRHFTTLGDVKAFMLAGPLIGALSAALVGGAAYAFFFGIQTNFLDFVRIWWFGDGLGLMIFTPLLLGFLQQNPRSTWRLPTLDRTDLVIGLVALTALGMLMASRQGMLFGLHVGPVMLLPLIIYVAVRSTLRWVACAIAVVALVIVVMLTHGNNPFGSLPGVNTVVQAQEFIFITSLLGLGSNALLSQVSAKQREIEQVNQHLVALNNRLEARVGERTAELNMLNTQLAQLAQTDALTGVLNRRGFIERVRREIDHSKRYNRPLAVMILDIDHFKSVNDRYGHQAGDQVLQHVAALIGEAIRPSDTFARYGGEEFVVLAPETDFEPAVALGTRILQAIRGAAIPSVSGSLQITASLGLTARCDDRDDVDQLLKRADEALYMAKARGRDQLVGTLPDHAPTVVPGLASG